ncbi:MAG TPA: hypothetical protein VFV58_39580 [Blastocatellia bacterium]|jgi:hypothetical protein|nr:hypothetical protein [Blastocatellia bacterium]
MKKRDLLWGVILISFIPIGVNRHEARIDFVKTREYVVYSALLDEINESPRDGKEVNLLVINDQTEGPDKRCVPDEIAQWYGEVKSDELKPLFENLIEKNKDTKPLYRKFKVNRQYVLLNMQNFVSMFEKRELDGWNEFYKKYPGSSGYITFSRVGFNSDETKALIYRQTNCGGLCGYGGYILLSKDNGAWKEIGSYGCWES